MSILTASLLRSIMGCGPDRAAECFPAMVEAMRIFHIDTPNRIRQFFTQVKHESGGLVHFAEIASGEQYNNRKDLGNGPTDGPRFKGSGPLQVTGRSNFEQAQRALDAAGVKINIVENPDLARTVKYGFWISCWWWGSHGGNAVAEDPDQHRAAVRCGRLVNRGDADSPSRAQDEANRLARFNEVSEFGDLALPGSRAPVTEVDVPLIMTRDSANREVWATLGPQGIEYIDQPKVLALWRKSGAAVLELTRAEYNGCRASGTSLVH